MFMLSFFPTLVFTKSCAVWPQQSMTGSLRRLICSGLYNRLKEIVLSSDYREVDESTLPIVSKEKHKTVKGYIWMVRAVMLNQVFFHYDHGSRAQKVMIPLLRDFRGALQTDGYKVYKIYEDKKRVLPLGCWAHAEGSSRRL